MARPSGSSKRSPNPRWEPFGRKIRDERLRQRLTQADVTKRPGISKTVVSNLESGQMAPTSEHVSHFAMVLKIPSNELSALLDREVVETARLDPVDPARHAFMRDHQIEVLYADICFRFGASQVPLEWEELIAFRSSKSGLRQIFETYFYSGDPESTRVEVLSGGSVVGTPSQTYTGDVEQSISLNRELRLGESHQLHFKVLFDQDSRPPRPFFTKTFTTPWTGCRELLLRLQFDTNFMPREVRQVRGLSDAIGAWDEVSEPLPRSRDGYYELSVRDLAPHDNVGFEWKW